MPDQLILDLAAPVPRLPSSLRPMLARAADEPFDSREYLFEPSWGGLRALAFVEPDPATGAMETRFVDADGRDVTAAFADLRALPDALASPFAVLDGELVVPDGSGHADGAAMHARLGPRPAARPARESSFRGGGSGEGAARGESAMPSAAVFLAFDLLYTEGRPLLGQPLSRRRQLLRSLVSPAADVLVIPAVAGDGRALFEAAVKQRLPAIVGKHARGPYLPGRRSSLWRSVSTAGRVVGADRGEASTEELSSPARPVLALIRKLPLALDD